VPLDEAIQMIPVAHHFSTGKTMAAFAPRNAASYLMGGTRNAQMRKT
jgi:hypothetical protein